ncbi:MAG: TrkA family potassium uptake protein [Dehalococcoidia bacterium]|nr:TrkA family potassium uptake protein [Dehalococcoidia bacterium]MSQ34330.1 TrkA family potassium uptake protein [Dehalococcoidia bacterium]
MKRQVVVIGLGRFGANVARTLYQLGHDVMGIDSDEAKVQGMMGEVTYAVRGDATQESVLRDLGVHNFDIAIVAVGANVEASIMVSVLLKTMNMKYVVARAYSELHRETLERIGCNRVINPESEMGVRMAHSLFAPDVDEYMEMTSAFGISRLKVPERFTSLTLREAGFSGVRDKYGVAVIALKRGEDITLSPDLDEKLRAGDILVVAGRDDLVEKIAS